MTGPLTATARRQTRPPRPPPRPQRLSARSQTPRERAAAAGAARAWATGTLPGSLPQPAGVQSSTSCRSTAPVEVGLRNRDPGKGPETGEARKMHGIVHPDALMPAAVPALLSWLLARRHACRVTLPASDQ
eukprot:356832-Chlamydomonas_euryale.AAC.2